ncbi:anthranilate synthase component I family protein [Mucilaginibacter ginkgonis]|uniref:Anthranilate synthase component I family protein n=1 Tax=Mucilaginibacter ginkgonis TaxID=2682091 RepID=A0A6I4I3A8_9SPHI|nr:anthranilate synthase component I family protein [Mucilaginibacter ginkgonis]QQL51552.1 anthranilate synthase component I family protein [Mucilaginibacter ginkgonis]
MFTSNDITLFKKKALQWASSFEVCCYLDSNSFADKYSKFDALIAAGVKRELTAKVGNAFDQLQQFHKTNAQEWRAGFLTYDLKNELENLQSDNLDGLDFPEAYFFVPQHLIRIHGSEIEILSDKTEEIFDTINNYQLQAEEPTTPVDIKSRLTKPDYLQKVNLVKEHISRGDIYVTNFCQEFYADNVVIDPIKVFDDLNQLSPNPFACFFKYYDHYAICASPERFLAKRDNKLISQPIKGTAPRGLDATDDAVMKQQLTNNTKEQQENVMVVDMVRNDLTPCAKRGTVQVEELFGLYTFEHLHQMISTVTCDIDENVSAIEAIKAAYPMGSMTGAPKVNAMQLMESFEVSKRGIYSGSIGYFSPDGDFDFNVVIRTLLYNASKKYLSFHTGSAITHSADAEAEYQECLLKIGAIRRVLRAR